ncbi:uncharacterized protein E0L32_004561 [Thyridium curvatum]|uniref:Serpin domain-containing protein n=1 Tax=Thyridium curvatum TaxID=1093900 RepID=A0A507B9J3_9PEZI|nr:uncharacterized protein E0L32_004561 [Thyridium curvatum]TPX15284.1 hypothetical protein E0L32_004561 [Thyridium curvatum]
MTEIDRSAAMTKPTAAAISNLAWALIPKLQDGSGPTKSVFFSPLSIVVALGMLTGAADAETKRILLSKLGVENDKDLQDISGLATTEGSSSSSSLSVANAIFADQTITLFDAYKAFLAGFHADFVQYPNLAEEVEKINSWISDHTHGLIQNMLSQAALRQSHVVIVNALAFKGSWETEFDEKYTRSVPFHLNDKEQRFVRMMYLQQRMIWCRSTSSYDAVRLPYGTPGASSNQTSMVAYLPKIGSSIGQVIQVIQKEGVKPLDEVFSKTKYHQFGFPRFEITGEYSLKASLRELGFPVDKNFPNMGTGDSLVQEVVHKAFIQVDEKGTTAAAATAVLMTRSRPVDPRILVFDRPFIFSIMLNDSGASVFSGLYYGD